MAQPTGTGRSPNAGRGLAGALGAVTTGLLVVALVVAPLTGWTAW